MAAQCALVDRVCLVWCLLVLVVYLPSAATSPPIIPYLPRLCLYQLFPMWRDWFVVLCHDVPYSNAILFMEGIRICCIRKWFVSDT